MVEKSKSLDDIFGDYEAERLAEIAKDETPEAIARRNAKREAEKQKEIRQGLRDANGDWIEQPETDETEDDDETEDE